MELTGGLEQGQKDFVLVWTFRIMRRRSHSLFPPRNAKIFEAISLFGKIVEGVFSAIT